MKIPDPIYDQYYFSSPENQEAILRVVENLITEQKKELMEEALARENILKDVHNLELDSISCKSLEEFMKWSNYRKNSKSLKDHD